MEAFGRNCPLGGLLCHPGWEEMRQAERSLSALLFVLPFPPASLLHVYTLSVQVKVFMNAVSHARWHTRCSLSSRASDQSRPVEFWLQDSLLVSLIWGDLKQPKWIPQLLVPLLLLLLSPSTPRKDCGHPGQSQLGEMPVQESGPVDLIESLVVRIQ